jgi:hypothetical protein
MNQLQSARVLVVALGLAMMVWAGFFISSDHFPGWIASIPVTGAVLVIAAGPTHHRLSFDSLFAWRPIQFLGDISYSVYLWHWPFVVLMPWVCHHNLDWLEKIGVIGVVIGLSALSKTHIEDRFRGSRPLGVPLRRTWIFLITGMLATVLVGVGGIQYTHVVAKPGQPVVIPPGATCVGAAMLLEEECAGQDPHGDTLYMSPLQAKEDKSIAYVDECWWSRNNPDVFPLCLYGSTDTDAPQIAVWGNSHVGPYLDPLIDLANDYGWGMRTYLASQCMPSYLPLEFGNLDSTEGCLEFTRRSIDDMRANHVQLVIMSVRAQSLALADVPEELDYSQKQETSAEVLHELLNNGMSVLVIRDVPFPPNTVVDCLAMNFRDVDRCDSPFEGRYLPDPLYESALEITNPKLSAVDFSPALCDETMCFDVVGGVITYFDQGHMTTTFARTLTPYLEPLIVQGMRSP